MGEYAELMLQFHMRSGFKVPTSPPRKRPRCNCQICGKEVEATEGLKMHLKAKHKIKTTKEA